MAVDPELSELPPEELSREDSDLLRIRAIAVEPRARGTEPPLPGDACCDVSQGLELCQGVQLPSQHCTFRRCEWVGADEHALAKHVYHKHITADERITSRRDAQDFYIEALA